MNPLPLTKMLLVLEYLLHYFYDPPAELLEQVCNHQATAHTDFTFVKHQLVYDLEFKVHVLKYSRIKHIFNVMWIDYSAY